MLPSGNSNVKVRPTAFLGPLPEAFAGRKSPAHGGVPPFFPGSVKSAAVPGVLVPSVAMSVEALRKVAICCKAIPNGARVGLAYATDLCLYDDRMTDETTPEQLRQHLKDLDDELAELRRVTADVQSRRGGDSGTSEGFQEPEDIATELTGLNETEAVIDELEQRRERLEAQLKALG